MTNKERDSFRLQVIDRNGHFEQYNFDTEAKARDFQKRLINETNDMSSKNRFDHNLKKAIEQGKIKRQLADRKKQRIEKLQFEILGWYHPNNIEQIVLHNLYDWVLNFEDEEIVLIANKSREIVLEMIEINRKNWTDAIDQVTRFKNIEQ